MPGLLGYNNSAPGLLGNTNQAMQSYAMQGDISPDEVKEYEQAKQQGFQGTFEDWRKQKRARQMVMNQQGGFQMPGMMGGY